MRPARLMYDHWGVAMVEALVSFSILAVAVPGILGWIALTNWNDMESRALVFASVVSQHENEWLQAQCSTKIRRLVETVHYDPSRPITCENYPNHVTLDRTDSGVPGMTFRVDITALPGEEGNYDLALVTHRAAWQRAFLMARAGRRNHVGILFGPSEEYWESYEEWRTRSGY